MNRSEHRPDPESPSARKPHVLVVDDDPETVALVRIILEKRGYSVGTASNGEEGFLLAATRIPDLIISDVKMPKLDGWTFVKRLRSRPDLAFVPVIFFTQLASIQDCTKGFRLGADDYLPKGALLQELAVRVDSALERRRRMEESIRRQPADALSSTSTDMRGTFDQFGVAAVLTLLGLENRSGVLRLASATTDGTVRMYLMGGRVMAARLRESGRTVENEEAVYEALTWTEGSFEVTLQNVDVEDQIGITTTALLMEAARRQDESRR